MGGPPCWVPQLKLLPGARALWIDTVSFTMHLSPISTGTEIVKVAREGQINYGQKQSDAFSWCRLSRFFWAHSV